MQTLPLNNKKRNHPIQKRAKDLNGCFSKNDLEIADKHMKILEVTNHCGRTHENQSLSHPPRGGAGDPPAPWVGTEVTRLLSRSGTR